jgi:hypothetical protein
MYNEEIVKVLLENNPVEQVKIFCKIESMKNKMLAEDYKKRGITDTWPYEFDYDAEWWENKYNELLNNM